MSYFEMKTHQIGRTYSNPHFFILSKGLNSGKPMMEPCPNCFVVICQDETEKIQLFHLSMMLQIGGFYAFCLVGSVIPFLRIKDCKNTLLNGLDRMPKNSLNLQKHVRMVTAITKKEEELQAVIKKVSVLKVAYIKSCFKP
jgi:hypothetical protein